MEINFDSLFTSVPEFKLFNEVHNEILLEAKFNRHPKVFEKYTDEELDETIRLLTQKPKFANEIHDLFYAIADLPAEANPSEIFI